MSAARSGMRVKSLGLAVPVLLAAALLAACGGKGNTGDEISGRQLTIYASLPMHGASRVQAKAVLDGARLALAAAHDRVGRYHVSFKPLDDSTSQRGEWDPGQTSVNGRLAAADPTTVGYLGELNSGASAVSIPLLNRLGIVQVSPSSTAVGLTTEGPGASPGEPQKYYPTGARTFARVVPTDEVQAAAQVILQRSVGCRRTYVLEDGEVDGEDMATTFSLAAHNDGLAVPAIQAFDTRATDYRSVAAALVQTASDCALISAITENNAVRLTRQLASLLPKLKIFGTAGLAESTYTEPAQGGIPSSIDPRVMLTVATLPAAAYPASGRRLLTAFDRAFGPPQPYAIYGYESMSLLLDAISRASHDGTAPVKRSAVRSALFATRGRHSVLGTYSIEPSGDTTLRSYGVYRVMGGKLSFWKAIAA